MIFAWIIFVVLNNDEINDSFYLKYTLRYTE